MAGSSAKSEFAAVIVPAELGKSRQTTGAEQEVLALFDALQDRLFRYLTSFMLPAPDAEEIIQETFLALFQHLQRGGSRTNLRGWLFRVAHNLALKRLQARHRHGSCGIGAEHALIDPAPSVEDRLADRQRQAHLQAVLSALPEQDRRCLSLRAEGLRYREIAQVLGMSLGAVSLSLSRSLARIGRADANTA